MFYVRAKFNDFGRSAAVIWGVGWDGDTYPEGGPGYADS